MKNFREWKNDHTFHGWRAKKAQVLRHWGTLPPNRPMAELRIIPRDHEGSTLSFDGIRISGSSNFIDAILSRLKDLLAYEGHGNHLQVIYKQQVDSHTEQPVPDSYVFYVQTKQGADQMFKKAKLIKPAKPLI